MASETTESFSTHWDSGNMRHVILETHSPFVSTTNITDNYLYLVSFYNTGHDVLKLFFTKTNLNV